MLEFMFLYPWVNIKCNDSKIIYGEKASVFDTINIPALEQQIHPLSSENCPKLITKVPKIVAKNSVLITFKAYRLFYHEAI